MTAAAYNRGSRAISASIDRDARVSGAAAPGDWLIRGVKGELYPCKPDIFAATYEPAWESSSAAKGEP